MRVLRAYKTELDLTRQQITACKQHAGAARYAYNWGLKRKQETYQQTGKSPTAIDLHRELNALKKTDLPWMYQVSKCAPQEALRNLDTAFAHYFRRCQQKQTGHWRGKVGYPAVKSRKKGLGSFRLTGTIHSGVAAIQLPRLGRLRLKERGYLPATGTTGVNILSATVSEQAGRWYVSVQVEQDQTVPDNTGPVVGVDLGVKTLATLSDGTVIPNPRPLKRRLKQVKRLHKIEDLHVAGMLKNDHLAQAIADVGFAEFRRQLTYKAAWYGSRVVVVSRWEPTSKRCSACGWLDADLTLADRVFCCEACGLTVDRDLNAAINLARLAASSADTENACGGERAGLSCERQVKRSPAKQEPNTLTSRVD